MFACIYCKRSEPRATTSESHIIPDSFGAGPTLLNAVCEDCNHRINKHIEEPLKDDLATLRNMSGIDGRRGRPSFLAKVRYLDAVQTVRLRAPADLDRSIFFFRLGTNEDGKKQFAIIGDSKKATDKQSTYQERHPDVTWTEIEPEEAQGLEIEFEIDLGVFATRCAHRLAAKIAFEYYCKKRSPDVVLGHEFDLVRKFILDDENFDPRCLIITNPTILEGLWQIPFPMHAFYVDQRFDSQKTVAIVCLFGLIYYGVILKSVGRSLATQWKIYLVNPQSGEEDEPTLRGFGNPPNLHGRIPVGHANPVDAVRSVFADTLKKLNEGLASMWANTKDSQKDES